MKRYPQPITLSKTLLAAQQPFFKKDRDYYAETESDMGKPRKYAKAVLSSDDVTYFCDKIRSLTKNKPIAWAWTPRLNEDGTEISAFFGDAVSENKRGNVTYAIRTRDEINCARERRTVSL